MHRNDIALRHVATLVYLAEMAERGEMVDDLSHSVVKSCLLAMQAAGAEANDVYRMFGRSIRTIAEKTSIERASYRTVLQSAYMYMAFLLLSEERVLL